MIILSIILVFAGCSNTDTENKKWSGRTAFVDTVFTNKFLPSGDGFTGSDGTYSVQLPDGRTLWIFGDTFIGNVTPEFRRIKTSPSYIRNSFVTFHGDSLITHHQGEPHEFKSMMIPPEVADGTAGRDEVQLWYWPGAAFIENGKLNVFVSKFFQEDHEDMWGFQFQSTELVEFSLPDLSMTSVHRFDHLDSIHFGHAILETDQFTYLYGLKKDLPYVARAKKGAVRKAWEFYAGEQWVDDASKAVAMLQFPGSEQFSVFGWKGKFVLIMQEGNLGRRIYSFTGNEPHGPWENKTMVYETPLPDDCESCWTYNALAHPQFTKDDLLLVSYNTNSMKMQDHYDNALIYRPRFVRIPMENIIP